MGGDGAAVPRCAVCGARTGDVPWCGQCGWTFDETPQGGRPGDGAYRRIDWRAVRATTRWSATVVTFGPRVKVLICLPLWLSGAVWLLAVAFVFRGPMAALSVAVGVPVLGAIGYLTAKVWARGPKP